MRKKTRSVLLLLIGLLLLIIQLKADTGKDYYQQIVKMKDGKEVRFLLDTKSEMKIIGDSLGTDRKITFKTKSGSNTLNINLISSVGFEQYMPEECTLDREIGKDSRFSLFTEALRQTGLIDSIKAIQLRTYSLDMLPQGDINKNPYPANVCQKGFTVFAETDSVMHLNGINTFDDLVAYANSIYATATEWYDYIGAKSLSISTGNDYTNPLNALNMFVAYHLLNTAIPENWLIYEHTNSPYWNYSPNISPYDYYETMLPSTLIKVWEPYPGQRIYINRYQTNNTLTDETGTQGTAIMHELKKEGIEILRSEHSITAHNGYVHPIGKMLVYDKTVPQGVLHERMRFNCTTLMPELITNGWQQYSAGEIPFINYDDNIVGIPLDYSENIIFNNQNVYMAYLTHCTGCLYQGDGLLIWGNCRDFDVCIKLPPIPSGKYEIRLPYIPSANGGIVQCYWGTNRQSLMALGIPVDFRKEAASIGWTKSSEEEDSGVASDKYLRNMGYMRGAYSYCESGKGKWSETNNCRVCGSGTIVIRKIIGQVSTDGQASWLRLKGVTDSDFQFLLDYIELCPVSVYENDTYMEDWF